MAEDEIVGWHHSLMDMNLSKLWEIVKDRGAWSAAIRGVTELDMTGKQLNNNKNNNSDLLEGEGTTNLSVFGS